MSNYNEALKSVSEDLAVLLSEKFRSYDNNFESDNNEEINIFFNNELLRDIRKVCYFKEINVTKFCTRILKQEDIYKIFERC